MSFRFRREKGRAKGPSFFESHISLLNLLVNWTLRPLCQLIDFSVIFDISYDSCKLLINLHLSVRKSSLLRKKVVVWSVFMRDLVFAWLHLTFSFFDGSFGRILRDFLLYLFLIGHNCQFTAIILILIFIFLLCEYPIKHLFLAVKDLFEEPSLLPFLHGTGTLILVNQEGLQLGLLEPVPPRLTLASAT
jgi:hypothetical protein